MTGVILFRAQPFHKGHLEMIRHAYMTTKYLGTDLYVFIGSADKEGTKRNPLPINIRLDLVKGAVREAFVEEIVNKIHIIPLNDLSDEANNTETWGKYLYDSILPHTNDPHPLFFYSDKPDIMLSWFSGYLRSKVSFCFLDRIGEVSATEVRRNIEKENNLKLQEQLPKYVYDKLHEIRPYILLSK